MKMIGKMMSVHFTGGCMLTRLQGTVLSRQQKLNFCRDICFGMAYLERQNVVFNATTKIEFTFS